MTKLQYDEIEKILGKPATSLDFYEVVQVFGDGLMTDLTDSDIQWCFLSALSRTLKKIEHRQK